MQHKKGTTKERVYVKEDHQESFFETRRANERENHTHTRSSTHHTMLYTRLILPSFHLIRFFPTCPFFPFSHVSFRNICV